MIRVLKLTIFIAHFPLSLFLFFWNKIHNLNKLSRLHIPVIYVICIVAVSLFLRLPQAEAMFNEDIAIDPEAISLANTVTARPPASPQSITIPQGFPSSGTVILSPRGLCAAVIEKYEYIYTRPQLQGI